MAIGSIRSSAGLLCMLLLGAASPLRAQFRAEARVEAPIAAGSDVDPTSSATAIELDDRPRAIETLDEVLLEAPGAKRRRTGGYGGFTALSLRGAEAEHTSVLIGDVPLSSADGGAFDLSTLPPWLFESVEVYRGGAPVWLGAGGIGGVLRLVPRHGRDTRGELATSATTLGQIQGRGSLDMEGGPVSIASAAGLTSSSGQYPITIDRDPLVPGVIERNESNAQLLEASGLVHARLRVADAAISMVGLGLSRTGGLPPPLSRWTDQAIARRTQTRALIALASDWIEGGRSSSQADLAAWRVQVVGSAAFDRRRGFDPFASYGQLPSAADQLLSRVSLRGAGTLRLLPFLGGTIVASLSHEQIDARDALRPTLAADSARETGLVALETRWFGRWGSTRWEVRPSGRVELVAARLREIRPERADQPSDSLHVLPTGRLAAVMEFVPGIALQTSAATAVRAPSSIELFGDGAFLLGDTRLSPETSRTVDAGLVLRGRAGVIQGFFEARGFGLFIDDLIRYRRAAQGQVVPENIASAQLAGLETSVRASVGRMFALVASFTWLESRDTSLRVPRELPYRPRFSGYVRPTLSADSLGPFDRVSIYVDLDGTSRAFDTPENDVAIPEVVRCGFGVSLEAWTRRVRLEVMVRDLFDARGRDFLDRALPGRSLGFQLSVRVP